MHPDNCRVEISIKKILWVICQLHLDSRGSSGTTNRVLEWEPFHSRAIVQRVDGSNCSSSFEREVAPPEELDDIVPLLSPRQEQMVLLLLEKQSLSEISSNLSVCESTIDKEIATIKKVFGSKLEQRATRSQTAGLDIELSLFGFSGNVSPWLVSKVEQSLCKSKDNPKLDRDEMVRVIKYITVLDTKVAMPRSSWLLTERMRPGIYSRRCRS